MDNQDDVNIDDMEPRTIDGVVYVPVRFEAEAGTQESTLVTYMEYDDMLETFADDDSSSGSDYRLK